MNGIHILLEVWFITLNAFNFYFYTLDPYNYQRNLESIHSDQSKLIGFIVVSISNAVTFLGIIICFCCLIRDIIQQVKAKKKELNRQKVLAEDNLNKSQAFTIQESYGNQNTKEEVSTLRESILLNDKKQLEEDLQNVGILDIQQNVNSLEENITIQEGYGNQNMKEEASTLRESILLNDKKQLEEDLQNVGILDIQYNENSLGENINNLYEALKFHQVQKQNLQENLNLQVIQEEKKEQILEEYQDEKLDSI